MLTSCQVSFDDKDLFSDVADTIIVLKNCLKEKEKKTFSEHFFP